MAPAPEAPDSSAELRLVLVPARAERIWRRTNRRHAAVSAGSGQRRGSGRRGWPRPPPARRRRWGGGSGGGDQGDTGEHGRQDEPVEPGGPRRRGGRDGLLAVGRVPRAEPDRSSGGQSRTRSRRRRYTAMPACSHAAAACGPGDDRDDPGPLSAEPPLAHQHETGRLDHAEDARVQHARCRPGRPPVDAAPALRRGSHMVAIGSPLPGGVVHVLGRAAGGQRGAPDHGGVTEVRGSESPPGVPAAAGAMSGSRGANRAPGGAVPAPHMPEIWLMAERARAPEAVRPVPRARVRPAVPGRAGSCSGSKMISRRTGPISPARGVTTRSSAIASLHTRLTASVRRFAPTGKSLRGEPGREFGRARIPRRRAAITSRRSGREGVLGPPAGWIRPIRQAHLWGGIARRGPPSSPIPTGGADVSLPNRHPHRRPT